MEGWQPLISLYLATLLSEVCSTSIKFKDALSYNFWSSPVRLYQVVPMHCEAEGFTASIGQHMKIIKSVRTPKNGNGETSEEARVILATNNRVEDSYRNTRNYQDRVKYQAALEVLSGKGLLTFTIRGVTGDDHGGYICEVLGSDGELQYTEMKMLTVLVPITAVFMSRLLPNGTEVRVQEGSSLAMYENTRGGIACNAFVDGAMAEPLIRVTADGKDITKKFVSLAPLDEVSLLPGSAYLYKYTTWRKKSYFTISPSLELNQKTIICSANTPGYEATTMTASLMLYVEAQPELTCDKYEYLAKPGDPVNMNCQVKSNPGGQIYFRFKNGNASVEEVVRLDAFGPFTERGYNFIADRKGDTTNVTVSIPTTQPQHYKYKFTLEAINAYGTQTQSLYLYKDMHYSSQTPHLMSSILLRTFCILLYVINR